jgi:WD40 repeat protein
VGSGNEVHLFDQALQEHHRLLGHQNHVYLVSFNRTGQYLLTSGADGTVRAWDTRSHALAQTAMGFPDEAYGLVVAPGPVHEERVVAASERGQLVSWKLRSGDLLMPPYGFVPSAQMLARPQRNQVVSLFEVAPQKLMVKTWNQAISFYDIALGRRITTPRQVLELRRGLRASVGAWSARSAQVPIPFQENLAAIWRGDAVSQQPDWMRGDSLLLEALSPSGEQLAVVQPEFVEVRRANATLERLSYEVARPNAVALGEDGTLVIGGSGGELSMLRAGRMAGERLVFPMHDAAVQLLILDARSRALLSASASGELRRTSMTTGGVVYTRRVPGITTMALSPDGRWLATGTLQGRVVVWDAATGDRVADLEAHHGPVNVTGFTADGQTLVSAGFDETVRLWSAARIAQSIDEGIR